MPNPIKYNTGAETLALQKGNFWIGTGAVGKGPTSTTGYYNGITPPSGGYTLYLNKASGGPSIYCPANDAALISLTNSIAGASYTTAQQCFNYYYTQTDKMCLSQDYPVDFPYIVLDGLVLYVDAGITLSYPGSGTTWTDINGLGPKNNGTLTNGPTFSSANGGSIVFDGVDDYVLVNKTLMADAPAGTFDIWFNLATTAGSAYYAVSNILIGKPSGPDNAFGFSPNTGKLMLRLGNATNLISSVSVNTGSWQLGQGVWDSTGMSIYLNGSLVASVAASGLTWFGGTTYDTVLGRNWVGSGGGSFTGNIGSVKVYNRALTSAEITQNYNAVKSRFGL